MDTLKRDPKFIAETLRTIRNSQGLTQENLADAAGLSSRTVEKAESGNHCPNEQTLRSISRALNLDIKVFDKPDPEKDAILREHIEKMVKKTVIIAVSPIRTATDFLEIFSERHAFRFDYSEVKDEESLRIVAELCDFISDLCEVWSEFSMLQRLEYAQEFIKLGEQLRKKCYICYMGNHRQQECSSDHSGLIFDVGVMAIQVTNETDSKRAMTIRLEDDWETLPEDRLSTDQILKDVAKSRDTTTI